MKHKVYITTTHSKIVFGADERTLKSLLKDKFTVRNPALDRDPRVLRGFMRAEHCFFDFEYSILPTGLVPHLKIYCKKEGIDLDIEDHRKFKKHNEDVLKRIEDLSFMMGKDTIRDYQRDAVLSFVKYRSGIINAATGTGKSFIFGAIASLYDKCNILCLFNRIDLMVQTRDRFVNDYKIKDVGMIGGGGVEDEKRITMLSVQSYQNAFHLYPHVDMIIMDECHETGRTDTSEKIIYSCQKANYKLGLSATVDPIENPYEKMRVHGNIGPIIHKIDYTEARDLGILSSIEVSMIETGTYGSIPIIGSWNDVYDTIKIKNPDDIPNYEKQGYEIITTGDSQVARKFLEYGDESLLYIYNDERNSLIKKIAESNERVLVLFTKLAHGRVLKELMPQAILISGETDLMSRKEAKKRLEDDPNTIVLASEIWSTGTDLPSLKNLILAGSSVGAVRVIQKLGRATRVHAESGKFNGHIYDFWQNTNPLSLKQSKKRLKIYEEILKIPVKRIKY